VEQDEDEKKGMTDREAILAFLERLQKLVADDWDMHWFKRKGLERTVDSN